MKLSRNGNEKPVFAGNAFSTPTFELVDFGTIPPRTYRMTFKSSPHFTCDAKPAMSSSDDTGYSDLVQSVASSHNVQTLIEDLLSYFNIDSIPTTGGWSKVSCSSDESQPLDKVKDEFKREFYRSKKVKWQDFYRGMR